MNELMKDIAEEMSETKRRAEFEIAFLQKSIFKNPNIFMYF